MTITDTTTPTRSRRPAQSRKAPARWGRRRRLLIPRGRIRHVPLADIALHELMRDGDVYKIGRGHYLVAPISRDVLETLIIAAGSTEDDEPSLVGGGQTECDALVDGELGADDAGEPSLGGGDEDLEGDGLYDDAFGGDMSLGWANEGSQEHLSGRADEDEPSLGWTDIGTQLFLAAGYSGGMIRESDGDCDDEPEPVEYDPCDFGEPENEDGTNEAPAGTVDAFAAAAWKGGAA
jgi:hypothetical protein